MQVYLYISSSKHVLGCLVAEQITSASPVVPGLNDCFTSSATSTDPLIIDPFITPMSAPPYAKRNRFSSQPKSDSPSSTVSVFQSAFAGCCTGPQLNSMEQPASDSHAQQHVSVGSSQSALVASPALVSSQPASKQPKQNVLTKWLATSHHKAAAAPRLPSSLRSDSPISAGSAAASRPEEEEEHHAAVDSKPAGSDMGAASPMAPLTDVTNMLPASIASESSSMPQEPLFTKDNLYSFVSEEGTASAVLGEQQQQQQAETELHSVTRHTCQQQHSVTRHTCQQQHKCHRLQTNNHPADSQQVSAGAGLLLGGGNGKQAEVSSAQVSADARLEQGQAPPAEDQRQMLRRLQSAVVRVDRKKIVKAACGVKVMWVSAQARRRGIATLLLDTARFALAFSSARFHSVS